MFFLWLKYFLLLSQFSLPWSFARNKYNDSAPNNAGLAAYTIKNMLDKEWEEKSSGGYLEKYLLTEQNTGNTFFRGYIKKYCKIMPDFHSYDSQKYIYIYESFLYFFYSVQERASLWITGVLKSDTVLHYTSYLRSYLNAALWEKGNPESIRETIDGHLQRQAVEAETKIFPVLSQMNTFQCSISNLPGCFVVCN